ncbi:MAG: His/Gly/Thr/Pro-type tRNA ligase C-terminal domain-containing protein, partial [Patescibacteria group bacterium]
QVPFAKEVADTLIEKGFRVELDESDEGLGKKVRRAKVEKTPYILVIGEKEVAEKKVSVESRDKGNLGVHSLEELLPLLK